MTKEKIIEEFRDREFAGVAEGSWNRYNIAGYLKACEEIEPWLTQALTTLETETVKRAMEEIKTTIGEHNARILNEFQLQGTQDMPIIAYDESVCLIPAIEIATNETFSRLSTLISDKK